MQWPRDSSVRAQPEMRFLAQPDIRISTRHDRRQGCSRHPVRPSAPNMPRSRPHSSGLRVQIHRTACALLRCRLRGHVLQQKAPAHFTPGLGGVVEGFSQRSDPFAGGDTSRFCLLTGTAPCLLQSGREGIAAGEITPVEASTGSSRPASKIDCRNADHDKCGSGSESCFGCFHSEKEEVGVCQAGCGCRSSGAMPAEMRPPPARQVWSARQWLQRPS